jgi:tight adherence protein B
MALSVAVFFLSTFVLVALAIMALRWLGERTHSQEPPAGDAEQDLAASIDATLFKTDSLSTISFWDELLKKVDGVKLMKARIAEAGMTWSVGRLTMMMLVSGTATLAVMRVFSFLPGWFVLLGSAVACAGPYLVVLRRRRKRMLRIEEQLPEALETLARSLRAGNPLIAGLEVLGQECKAPLAGEMRKLVDECTLGRPLEESLQSLLRRVPVAEVGEFVAVVQLQSRTGGKLHEVLSRLSETMREAASLKSEIRSIAAHGRLTGLILTLMPVGIAAVMTYVNPEHMLILWNHPSGRDFIGAALVCLVLAHIVIRKMVDIKV